MKRMSTVLASVVFAAAASAALAGEQYVDGTGYAVSGYDVVSYFDIEQSAVGDAQPVPLPGNAALTADYNGATWAFATEENRDRFLADPAKFAPAYDGHCAFGVAQGGKVPGNPTLWRIVDDTLYLNITKNVAGFWEADIPGNITLSEGNWPGLEPVDASAMAIPEFSSSAPVN